MDTDLKEKHICYDCIGESFLKAEIEREGLVATCSYCKNDELECYSLLKLADRIDTAFEQHYDRQSENSPDDWSLYQLKYLGENYIPDGEPIIDAITDAIEASEEIASDIQQLLENKHYSRSSAEIGETTEYNYESYYDTKDPDDIEWQEQWKAFEHGLKTRARFFNKEGAAHLSSIFHDIEHLNTHDKKPVVRIIGPGTDLDHLFRARAFQSDAKLKTALEDPGKELGPPPPAYAKAGRMNANGISVFYGATKPKTALSEIRPPVGSNVIIAKFELTRPLKMLDLSALTYTTVKGSIFNETYAALLSKTTFLRKLSQKMTKVVMPDDENFEYLPTQVIADFLGSVLEFDGIVFPSAQSGDGLNVVLFNHASRVKTIEYPKGTKVRASLTDWYDDIELPDYSVTALLPEKTEPASTPRDDLYKEFLDPSWKPEDPDPRVVSMSIDLKSITVENITSVEIHSKSFPVAHDEHKVPAATLEHDPFAPR